MSPKRLAASARIGGRKCAGKRLDPRGAAPQSTVPDSAPYDTAKNF